MGSSFAILLFSWLCPLCVDLVFRLASQRVITWLKYFQDSYMHTTLSRVRQSIFLAQVLKFIHSFRNIADLMMMHIFLDAGDNVNKTERDPIPLDLILVTYCCVKNYSKMERHLTTFIFHSFCGSGIWAWTDLWIVGASDLGSLL